MHIYMAAVYTNNYLPGGNGYLLFNEFEQKLTCEVPHILESYHYVQKQRFVDIMRAHGKTVFLDSGAFSAHTLGAHLSVEDYCKYIIENRDLIRVEDNVVMASVLDGIGDPLKTYQNQMEMEWRGAKPLPCFHFGEDERYLNHYIKNYPYITLGGMVGKSKADLFRWLDRIWENHLTDGTGAAKLKVHGFGITTIDVMERYPWYSCDSSSWIQAASFGSIYTPKYGPLRISDKSPARHELGQHISNFSEIERTHICTWLESQGFSFERLSTVYASRAAYNMHAYGELNELINKSGVKKFDLHVQELF